MKLFKDKGIWIVIALSFFALIFFYGELLTHPNKVYFSKTGDGLQSYYTTLYHIRYDSTYSVFQGMNYPYGEHVLFTNCLLPISNSVKFISNNIIDISGYAIGIINLVMLFSILIAATFLYLIFKEFGVNQYYSAFVAAGIAFLSPQISRFQGHYSLSFVFVIPVFLFLIIKFFKKPSWRISLFLGIFVLVMTTFHMYYFAIAAIILGAFWLFQFFSNTNSYKKWSFILLNIALQIILPILIIYIWLWFTNTATDRTSHPGGFLSFKSGWEGIFLPDLSKTIEVPFLKSIIYTNFVSWEGWSYIGHVSAYLFVFLFTIWGSLPFLNENNFGFFLIILIVGIILNVLYKKRWNQFFVTQNKLIDFFLWTGFLSLIISYAVPFSYYPKLLQHVGFVSQFRGIGRFSWIFFFTINIGVFYFLFNLKINFGYLKYLLLTISILILYFDAYTKNKNMQESMNNSLLELNDTGNKLKANRWALKIVPNKYQAIIPVPYFHSGSENIGSSAKCDIDLYSFIVSLKTGLPMNAVMMSRTSLSQSFENIIVMSEPYRKKDGLIFKKSQKPFLLLTTECNDLSDFEKLIISKSKHLVDGYGFSFYELSLETLKTASDSVYFKTIKEFETENKFLNDSVFSNDSIKRFEFRDFENIVNKMAYFSKGCYTGSITDFNVIFDGTISNAISDTDYMVSFWLANIHKDVLPRTTIEITHLDSAGNLLDAEYEEAMGHFKIFDNNWGLVELKTRLKKSKDKIKITLWNDELSDDDTLFVDDLLIRPNFIDVFIKKNNNYIMKNNRFYLPLQ